MFRWAIYENGQLFGLRYSFPACGDGIGMHTHPDCDVHNIVVLRGSLDVYGPAKAWIKTLNAGDVFDLPPGPHEIAALEPSEMLGLYVNGKPAGLILDEFSGEVHNKPVTL